MVFVNLILNTCTSSRVLIAWQFEITSLFGITYFKEILFFFFFPPFSERLCCNFIFSSALIAEHYGSV